MPVNDPQDPKTDAAPKADAEQEEDMVEAQKEAAQEREDEGGYQ